jgi:hypothetical protein
MTVTLARRQSCPGFALDITQTYHVQQDPMNALQDCTALFNP